MALSRRNEREDWGSLMDWDWGMDTFRRRLDNLERSLFSDFGGTTRAIQPEVFNMKVDLKESDKCFELTADVPGWDKKDISIDLDEEKRMLSIKGEKKFEKEEKKDEGKYYFKERSMGSFFRSFRLPDTVDMNQLKANLNSGVLKIDIPKVETKQGKTPRSISIGDQGKSNA